LQRFYCFLPKHTALPYHRVRVFIETSTFTRLIGKYLSDDEYLGLQRFPLKRPDASVIIRGTGGVRKLRWAISGRGKSGGVSLRTVQDWEQGRREPSGPAKSLLRIAEQHPDVFTQLL
jgi:hypothetical protein